MADVLEMIGVFFPMLFMSQKEDWVIEDLIQIDVIHNISNVIKFSKSMSRVLIALLFLLQKAKRKELSGS